MFWPYTRAQFDVSCGTGQLLAGFELKSCDDTGSTMKYQYTCYDAEQRSPPGAAYNMDTDMLVAIATLSTGKKLAFREYLSEWSAKGGMTMSAIYAVSARRTYLPTTTAAPSFSKGLIDGVGFFDGSRVGSLRGLLDGDFYDDSASSAGAAALRERYFEATGADSPVFGVVRVTAWIVPKPLGLDVSDGELTWLASQAGFLKETMLTPDGVTVGCCSLTPPTPGLRI